MDGSAASWCGFAQRHDSGLMLHSEKDERRPEADEADKKHRHE